MKKLETLPVEQLQPGMRVASALADENGRVLLPAGTELSEAAIASLQRRGIQQIGIEFQAEDDPAAFERYSHQITERLDHLFRHAGGGSETMALYRAVAKYRMERRS